MLLLKNWMTIKPKLLKFVFPKEIYFNILMYFLSIFFHFRLFCCLLNCNHIHVIVFCWDPVFIVLQTHLDLTLMFSYFDQRTFESGKSFDLNDVGKVMIVLKVSRCFQKVCCSQKDVYTVGRDDAFKSVVSNRVEQLVHFLFHFDCFRCHQNHVLILFHHVICSKSF